MPAPRASPSTFTTVVVLSLGEMGNKKQSSRLLAEESYSTVRGADSPLLTH